MLKDPFLNYLALGLLIFVVVTLVYGIIAIHDIPAKIAKARHHPHEDAIHAAGWVSLFTLEILLTMTYVAICVAVFKIFRIPVNQWSLATAALGGRRRHLHGSHQGALPAPQNFAPHAKLEELRLPGGALSGAMHTRHGLPDIAR